MMRDSKNGSPSVKSLVMKKGGVPLRQERLCKRGSLLFIEGESGSEMFVVKSGKIRLLRQEGEQTAVAAVATEGSVIGEMSLLHREPRHFTAQVVEDSVVLPIDEEVYAATIKNIPPWLGGALQSLVKRLSETVRLTSDEMVRKGVAGVVRIMLLLAENEGTHGGNAIAVPLGRVREVLYGVTGLSDAELENVFLHLILKRMVRIGKDDADREFVYIVKPQVLHLYFAYLRARQRNEPFLADNVPLSALDLAGFLLVAKGLTADADRNEFIRMTLPELEAEWQLKGKRLPIDREALRAVAEQDSNGNGAPLVFNCARLRLLHLAGTWLPIFKEDVKL
jgi:CRP/FNR family transcriptional regulator, cyclic AMP receptor protein